MPSRKEALDVLLAEIECRREQALEKDAAPYPRNNPIASDLGECAREYVLAMTHWNVRAPFEPALVARLQRGRLIEEAVLRELSGLGLRVRTERTPFELKDRKGRVVLRGKLDGFVEWEQHDYPLEVKSVNPLLFPRLHSIEDMHKLPWMQKWPRQIMAYLYGTNQELGFFLLDDCLGHWRLVPVELNYEEMERILRRCEAAVEHVSLGTLPDFHPDSEVCQRCWAFGRVCFPPMDHPGITLTDDPELEAQLDRRAELEPAYREYQDLDETVKSAVKGKDGLVIGKWLVTGKEIQPKPVPPKPGYTPTPYWRMKFDRISVPSVMPPLAPSADPVAPKGDARPSGESPGDEVRLPGLEDRDVLLGRIQGLAEKAALSRAARDELWTRYCAGFTDETAPVENLHAIYAALRSGMTNG